MVAMPRDTIADLFASSADIDEPFLVYDDGYRSHSYTYRQTADAAREFRAQAGAGGYRKRRFRVVLGRKPPGMDRGVLGMRAARS